MSNIKVVYVSFAIGFIIYAANYFHHHSLPMMRSFPSLKQQVIVNNNNTEKPLSTVIPLINCTTIKRKLVGRIHASHKTPSPMAEKALSVEFGGTVNKGGWWEPSTCIPTTKVAVIIPYRKRAYHLKLFLQHMHSFLQKQQLYYRIIVVEQLSDDPFNRAGLFNIGFVESLKISPFDCFVFNDVDHLPEDGRNYYGCPTSPRHMSSGVDKFAYKLPYKRMCGGVVAFKKDHFEKINGMSNLFWGWGGEDDDLYSRIEKKTNLTRPSAQIGRYSTIKVHHYRSSRGYPDRFKLLKTSSERMAVDGLNTLKYHLKEVVEEPLVTFVKIEMKKRDYEQ